MKSSQQRIETEVKKTKGAQVRRENESGKRASVPPFPSLSPLSLSMCHAAAHINIIHCCLMSYYAVWIIEDG